MGRGRGRAGERWRLTSQPWKELDNISSVFMIFQPSEVQNVAQIRQFAQSRACV